MKDNNENTQHAPAELFCPKCGENIISMSVHYCATPPAERPTPITDALSDKYAGDPSCGDYRDELEKTCFDLERQLAEARRERDNAISDWKQADTDSIRAIHERNEAREQRDRLAEACRWAQSEIGKHTRPSPIDAALASMKGETE